MIDQTLLPAEYREIHCPDIEAVWEAIRSLRVRGAPAIGVSAAFGVIVGLQTLESSADAVAFNAKLTEVCEYLATSRPTAVNLFWALDRMKGVGLAAEGSTADRLARLLDEAKTIEHED